jgi:hypothetical protein
MPTEKGLTDIRVEDDVVKFRFMHDRLGRPQMNEVTEVGPFSATVSWQPVDYAENYLLAVREELPDSLNPILLDEDFSLMTDGEYYTSHYKDISSSLDDYTHTPGWTGSQLYSTGGYVRLGRNGVSGTLTTPHIPFAEGSDSCIVAFHAVSYPGKTMNYTVSLLNNDNQKVDSLSLQANKKEQEVVLVFHGVTEGCRITFETQKERLFLNDVIVLTDSLRGIWNAGPQEWEIDSIADTQYTLRGLAPNRTYHCKVMAMATNGIRESSYSDELTFTTTTATGIHNPSSAPRHEAWYDLQGRRVQQPSRGLYIRRSIGCDGKEKTEKIVKK